MARTRYVVAYDIRNNRRLHQVHSTVKEFGYALQYSVFICDLDRGEKATLRAKLADVVNHAVDSIVFMELGDINSRGKECFEFMGVRSALPTGGSIIV